MERPLIYLIRLPEVCKSQGQSKSSIYNAIGSELFPPPIRINRCSAWPSNEVEAVTKARIAGKTDDEIKALVRELITARTEEVA